MMNIKLQLKLLSIFLVISLYGCAGFLLNSKDEIKYEKFSFKGKALKKNGNYFAINSKVYALDAEGKIARGFVIDNEGNFAIDFFIDTVNEKVRKGLTGSILFQVVSLDESEALITILPYNFISSVKNVNLNAITQIVSSEVLKGLEVESVFANVKSISESASLGIPIQLDEQTKSSLDNFNFLISNSEIDEIATIVVNMLFGIDGIRIDFFYGKLTQYEIIVLLSAFNVSDNLGIEDIANIHYTPLMNQRLFYQEIANQLPSNCSFKTFFEAILDTKTDIYKTLDSKNDFGVSLLDQLEDYLITKENFEIDVSKVSPQYIVLFESGANGSVVLKNSFNNFAVVKSGENISIRMVPNLGFGLEALRLDGIELEPTLEYIIQSIDANHIASATFKQLTNTVSIGQPNWPLNDFISVSASYKHTIALRSNGKVMDWGREANYLNSLQNHYQVSNVDKIFSGIDRTFFILKDGSVVEDIDQIGDVIIEGNNYIDPNTKGALSIAVGNDFAITLLKDGTIVSNKFPLGDQGKDNIAISARNQHCLILKKNGIITELGGNSNSENSNQISMPIELNNIVAISAGSNHSVALKNDGTVVAWGDNSMGQCNVPAGLSDVVSISAGDVHTVALKNDGTVVEWGTLDSTSDFFKDFPTEPFPNDLSDVIAISAGLYHTVALKKDGSLVSWGINTNGQILHSTNKEIKNILGQPNYEIALLEDGTILGLSIANYEKTKNIKNILSMSLSEEFILLLKEDGLLWGSSLTSNSQSTFGNYDNFLQVFPEITDVKEISVGASHALFLRSDRTVEARGLSNIYEEISVPEGLSNVIAIASGGNHSLALKQNGEVVAWGKNENGESNVPVGLSDVIAIAAGVTHSVALKSDGTVVGWGGNEFGQLNIPNGLTGVISIKAGDYHTVALKSDGTVLAFGKNDFSQISIPITLPPVKSIDAGKTNTILSFK